jgi:2-methylisocitrate lyase-like PEP mutase family enzyme
MKHTNYEIFKQLHYKDEVFLLANVWDARSALIFQENGFEAVGTSSAAIANLLGYQDGEMMSFEELLLIVRRICANIQLPVSVDIEGGYSRDISEICANIRKLSESGVVGINIEDSTIEDKRKLGDAESFAGIINQLKSFCLAEKIDIFINVRTDAYLLDVENRFAETAERISRYENAGADGIFIPCATDLDEIRRLCTATNLPVNVLFMPDLPAFDELSEAGVKRISMGNFMFDYLSKQQSLIASKIRQEGNCGSLFL